MVEKQKRLKAAEGIKWFSALNGSQYYRKTPYFVLGATFVLKKKNSKVIPAPKAKKTGAKNLQKGIMTTWVIHPYSGPE